LDLNHHFDILECFGGSCFKSQIYISELFPVFQSTIFLIQSIDYTSTTYV